MGTGLLMVLLGLALSCILFCICEIFKCCNEKPNNFRRHTIRNTVANNDKHNTQNNNIIVLIMMNIALQNNNIIMIKTLTITVLKHNQKTNNHVIIDTTDSSSDTIPTPTFDTPAKSNIFGILEEKLFK